MIKKLCKISVFTLLLLISCSKTMVTLVPTLKSGVFIIYKRCLVLSAHLNFLFSNAADNNKPFVFKQTLSINWKCGIRGGQTIFPSLSICLSIAMIALPKTAVNCLFSTSNSTPTYWRALLAEDS